MKFLSLKEMFEFLIPCGICKRKRKICLLSEDIYKDVFIEDYNDERLEEIDQYQIMFTCHEKNHTHTTHTNAKISSGGILELEEDWLNLDGIEINVFYYEDFISIYENKISNNEIYTCSSTEIKNIDFSSYEELINRCKKTINLREFL